MTEIVENLNGIKLPVQRMFREMEINADRAYPDNDFTAQVLYDFFVNKSLESRVEDSKIIREKCLSLYTWDSVYKVWDEAFDTIDINKKLSWHSKDVPPVQNMSTKVPADLTNKEFIEFICYRVINDPHIIKTANIQNLIKELNSGLMAQNGNITIATKQHAVTILEGLLNNKIMCEKMRLDPNSLKKEDFIP
jgi:hypothetical protein